MADVLRNVPFDVGTTKDAQGQICVSLTLRDPSSGWQEQFVWDREPAVLLVEALQVAVHVAEGASPSN